MKNAFGIPGLKTGWLQRRKLNHCLTSRSPWEAVLSLGEVQQDNHMVVIKGKEKKLKKPLTAAKGLMSDKAKKKLRKVQDYQPIATVCVS